MSITYPEHTRTNFPDDTDTLFYLSDLETDDLILVNQYNALKTMEEKNDFLLECV